MNTPLYYDYIQKLLQVLQKIELPHRNGFTKYSLNCRHISALEETFTAQREQNSQDFLYPKNIKRTLQQLLKTQNSDEFEQLVTNRENVYSSISQKENKCRPNFILRKKKKS